MAARWRLSVRAPGVGTDEFLETVLAAIRSASTLSVATARTYYGTTRRLQIPSAPAIDLEPEEFVDDRAIAGLVASGLQSLSDALEAGDDLAVALEKASGQAQGSAVRTGLRAGRQLIRLAPEQDQLALGWYRTTAGDDRVCFFCAALASRGAVYRGDSFNESDPRFSGPGEVKVHDLCRCGFAALFTSGADLPDSVIAQRDAWDLSTGPFSGHDKLTAFRRYWSALQRGEDEILALARAHRDKETVARLSGSSMLDPTEEVA